MLFTLLANGVNRARIYARGAVDAFVSDCVSHGTTSSLDLLMLHENFFGGSLSQQMNPVQCKQPPFFLKKLAIQHTLH
jgi:hypothetical protein